MEKEIELYYLMRLTREFEDEVLKLYKQGKILGGVYCGYGQEAVSVGATYGLEKEDFTEVSVRRLSKAGKMTPEDFKKRFLYLSAEATPCQ